LVAFAPGIIYRLALTVALDSSDLRAPRELDPTDFNDDVMLRTHELRSELRA
jgi:hypothetical protein